MNTDINFTAEELAYLRALRDDLCIKLRVTT